MSLSSLLYIIFATIHLHLNSKSCWVGIFLLTHPSCNLLKDNEAMKMLTNLIFISSVQSSHSVESLGLQEDPTSPSWRRSVLGVHWKDWCWSWNSNTLATWCKELTHWKRPCCWEGLGAGGEGDYRGGEASIMLYKFIFCLCDFSIPPVQSLSRFKDFKSQSL